jgi:hypothetical protein
LGGDNEGFHALAEAAVDDQVCDCKTWIESMRLLGARETTEAERLEDLGSYYMPRCSDIQHMHGRYNYEAKSALALRII